MNEGTLMKSGLAGLALFGLFTFGDAKIQIAQADQCVQQCRNAHNQCRISTKGAASCDVQYQSCLQTWLTNLMIQPSPEGAIGWAYIWHVALVCGSPTGAAVTEATSPVKDAGLYRDVIVKTAEGWRFKKRRYTPGNTISPEDPPPL